MSDKYGWLDIIYSFSDHNPAIIDLWLKSRLGRVFLYLSWLNDKNKLERSEQLLSQAQKEASNKSNRQPLNKIR